MLSAGMARYEAVRSVNDESLHVICRDGDFESLPQRIRALFWRKARLDDEAILT